jgi:hypothetical protein
MRTTSDFQGLDHQSTETHDDRQRVEADECPERLRRNMLVFPARFLARKDEGRSNTVPRCTDDWATLFAALDAGCVTFFAFSFAANSRQSVAVMPSDCLRKLCSF